tara:strand:+ start:1150 stop:2367 length:1218 start_codon:yes stop_codon:yes gene_type:complete
MFPSRLITTMSGDVFRDEYSLAFDGSNDYVDCGDKSDWNFSNGSASIFTVSVWYKNSDASPDTYASLVAKNDTGANKREWRLSIDSSDAIVFVISADGSNVFSNTSTFTVDDFEWHHVVVTYNGSIGIANYRCQIYVDGVDYLATGHGSNPAILNEDDAPLTICSHLNSNAATDFWTGNISEVTLYNTALSASQVKTIYNGREPYNHNEGIVKWALKAWYRMGDGVFDQKITNLINDEVDISLGSNIVTNSDMELDDNWSNQSSPTTNERSTAEVYSGTYSRKVIGDSSGDGIKSDTFSLVDGNTYIVEFYYYLTTGSNNLLARLQDGDGNNLGSSAAFGTKDTWTKVMFCIPAETSGSSAYFKVYQNGSGSSTFYIDNVSVRFIGGSPGVMTNMAADDFEGDTP